MGRTNNFSLLLFKFYPQLLKVYIECIKNPEKLHELYDFKPPNVILKKKFNDYIIPDYGSHFFIARFTKDHSVYVFFLRNNNKSFFLRSPFMDDFRELTPNSFYETEFDIFGYNTVFPNNLPTIVDLLSPTIRFAGTFILNPWIHSRLSESRFMQGGGAPIQIQSQVVPAHFTSETFSPSPAPTLSQRAQKNTKLIQSSNQIPISDQEQQIDQIKMINQERKQKQFLSTNPLEDEILIQLFLEFYFSPYELSYTYNPECFENQDCYVKFPIDMSSKKLQKIQGIDIPKPIKQEIRRQTRFADTLSYLEILLLYSYSYNSMSHITKYLSGGNFTAESFYDWFEQKTFVLNVLLVPFLYFIFIKRNSPAWKSENRLQSFTHFDIFQNDHFKHILEQLVYNKNNPSEITRIFIEMTNEMNNYLNTLCDEKKFNQFELQTLLEIMAECIDNIFFKAPPLKTSIELYRGVDNSKFIQDASVIHQHNKIFFNRSFSSTAISKEHSLGYLRGNDNALLIITCPPGSRIIFLQPFTFFDREYEFILPRDTVFNYIANIKNNYHDSIRYSEIYLLMEQHPREKFFPGWYKVFNYKIGTPISPEDAMRSFIFKKIKRNLIHDFQKDLIDFEKNIYKDAIELDEIPLSECVQLRDGTIISKNLFERLINDNKSQWQNKDNIGFQNPFPEAKYIYGNLVCRQPGPTIDGEIQLKQKSGILLIRKITNNSNHKLSISSQTGSQQTIKNIYQFLYLRNDHEPYYDTKYGNPVEFYLPCDPERFILYIIEAFKKGNLFAFNSNTQFTVNYGGLIHLKTIDHSYPLSYNWFINYEDEFSKIGINIETLKNKKFDKYNPDPFPRETRFVIRYEE